MTIPDESDAGLDDMTEAALLATRAMVGLALRALEASGAPVTLAQYRMMSVLERVGELGVGALAEVLGVDRSTATRMVDRLHRAKFISRRSDPADGRAVLVSLTEDGEKATARVNACRRAELAAVLMPIPPRRRRQIVKVLTEFTELADRRVSWPR